MTPKVLQHIPSVSELLEIQPLRGLVDRLNRNVVVSGVRTALDELRREARAAAGEAKLPDLRELAERIARRIAEGEQPAPRPVINATGVLLHAGLGSAPLSDDALESLVAVGRSYANLEFDLTSGAPAPREAAVEPLLRLLSGAEAALVVNTSAAALHLALAALAGGREVVVSRQDMGEVDGCRLTDLAAGATLREVGAVHKCRVADYAAAIGPDTAALLCVQPTSWRASGDVERPTTPELVRLGQQHGLPVVVAAGYAALAGEFGELGGPTAAQLVADGADIVIASGSDLLGGPQCGLLVGRRELLDRLARFPLARALHVDKLTLAALAATLRAWQEPAAAERALPILHLLHTPLDNLRNRAERLAAQLGARPSFARAEAVADEAFLSGHAVAELRLRSWCVAVEPAAESAEALAELLRLGQPAVVARVAGGRVLLDLRSVLARQDQEIAQAFARLMPTAG
ncbi:MAG: L-seryl-tRNA(Sec) selenium transferase [Pirellulales bacterium]